MDWANPLWVYRQTCKARVCDVAHLAASWRCENEAFVRDVLTNLQIKVVQTKLSCETSFKHCKLKFWIWRSGARLPSITASWSCENEAFVRDFLPKLLFAVTVFSRLCFLAVIVFLQSSFFAVIVLCGHSSLQSLFFAVIVLCSHGSLRSWFFAVLPRPHLSKTDKHETVRGRGCSLAHIQAAAYQRAREISCANPFAFIVPNSNLFFLV